jgi:hypothetical protein
MALIRLNDQVLWMGDGTVMARTTAKLHDLPTAYTPTHRKCAMDGAPDHLWLGCGMTTATATADPYGMTTKEQTTTKNNGKDEMRRVLPHSTTLRVRMTRVLG